MMLFALRGARQCTSNVWISISRAFEAASLAHSSGCTAAARGSEAYPGILGHRVGTAQLGDHGRYVSG